MSILECENRGDLDFKIGFSGWDENQDNLFCFCKFRNINVSKWFCIKCRSPGIPCPKCGTYNLQVKNIKNHTGTYKCINCNNQIPYSKIKYLRLLAKRQKNTKRKRIIYN